MEDNVWLRLMTVGLVLTALAVGYFLLSGKLSSNSISNSNPSPEAVLGQNAKSSASPSPFSSSVSSPVAKATSSPVSSPTSAAATIAQRSQSNVKRLPNTGFPVFLIISISASAIIAGYGLRKFPH